eukprot:Nk52_evm1s2321 gene=Nk52_evmTU1s2321
MMNNKIPIALVFCLVAVSVSLAQPHQGLSKSTQSYYTVDGLNFFTWNVIEGEKEFDCWYYINHCDISKQKPKAKCIIYESNRYRKDCPILHSKHITFELTGDELSYSGLKFKSSDFDFMTFSPGKGTIQKSSDDKEADFYASFDYRNVTPYVGVHIFGSQPPPRRSV